MRLFGYYACHTFVNQVKKMLKTWVLVFLLVCGLLGGLIGFGAASLDEAAENRNPETEQQEEKPEEPAVPFEEKYGVSPMDVAELVAGGIILGIFVFSALSADKNGSKIFLPADVNLLFASPMKPQSVLMFRVATQLGLAFFGGLWLAIQIPNFMSMGASLWGAVSGIIALCMAVAVGSLVQVLLYTVCSTHVKMKKYIRQAVYGLLLLAGLGYFAYWKSTDYTYLQAAVHFFNHPVSLLIPFWGWIKAFFLFSMEEKTVLIVLSAAVTVLGSAVLGYVIWHVKADFYEDAMAKSQEIAARMEAAQSEKTVIQRRKKDRSDKLRRDEMGHGWGANVFFCRSMYNRFRFAHLHVFTKTSETYLAAALGVAALCRFVIEVPGLMPVCLTLGAFAFFRSLGNPLTEDTDRDFFRMIPESTWQKLFWSLLAGTVNCLLDLIPGMVAATMLLWENPLPILLWLPLIVSVDFFATAVGAFINLSVPVSAGKMIKQLVQVLFIYFGLLPDIAIMAVGIVFEKVTAAAVGTIGINIALGFAFMALLPLFIEPRDGKDLHREFNGDTKTAKKQFSRMGLAVFLFLLVSSGVQLLLGALLPEFSVHPVGMWVVNFAPIYLVGLPVCLLVLKKVPAEPIPQKTMKLGHWFLAFLIGIFMMVAGNYLSTFLLMAIDALTGAEPVNPLEMLVMDQLLLPKILIVVIIGPLVEELVFRKALIDRMHPYGGKLAVVTTAVLFGLFHGNLSQFFYAFTLGLVFGYIYLKTGKLRYSAAMHMVINFMGSVFAPWLLEHVDLEALETMELPQLLESGLPWLLAFGAYSMTLFLLAIAGLVILCANHRKITFQPESRELAPGKRFSAVYLNVGMLLIVAACVGLTVMTFLV